jgi:hypothetical protein
MKSIVIGAAIFAAFTSLAHADEIMGNILNSNAQMHPRAHKAVMTATNVVVNGRIVGRDPSASVRWSIANEYNSLSAAAEGAGAMGGDAGGAAAQ